MNSTKLLLCFVQTPHATLSRKAAVYRQIKNRPNRIGLSSYYPGRAV